MARPGNKAFEYVRAILATKDPCSGSPVLFAIGRVYRAHIELSRYVELMFQGPSSDASAFSGGELKRAVSEAFSNIAFDAIGNGSPPTVDGTLTGKEAREILVLTKKIRASYPDSFIEQKWDAACCRWIELASRYVSRESWIPNGIGRCLVIAAVIGALIGAIYPRRSTNSLPKFDGAKGAFVKDNGVLVTSDPRRKSTDGGCVACDGTGRIDVLMMCPICRGAGFVNYARELVRVHLRCYDCGGRGKVHWDRACPFCRNREGKRMRKELVTNNVAKNLDHWIIGEQD